MTTQLLDRQAAKTRKRHSVPTLAAWTGSRLLGLLLLGAAAYLTYQLSFARPYVAIILAACFFLQCSVPSAWLLYVPALLPIADLSLWSGRLYVSEFDLLILVTAAAHFVRAPALQSFPNPLRLGGWPIIAFLILWFLVGAVIGALPLKAPNANEIGSYLSHYNALRVVKNPLEALLLLGALQWRFAVSPERTKTLLIVGVSVGLAIAGLVVFWERGVFLAIVQAPGIFAGRYAIAGALLDFTTNYRATALFSEMSTGGEAIDTYFSLALPIAVAGAFTLRQPIYRLICLVSYALGTYAAVATFSRGLYAGYATGLLTVLVLVALSVRRGGVQSTFAALRIGAAWVLSMLVLIIAYTHGGWNALTFGLALGAACLTIGQCLGNRWRNVALAAFFVLALGGGLSFLHAFNSSHYVKTETLTAELLAAGCALGIVAAGALIGGRTIPASARLSAAMVYVLFAATVAIAVPAVGGYRMVERFSTASNDANTRSGHWREALRLMGSDWRDYAFGMGLGSFPRLYFRGGDEQETKPSYRYDADSTGTWAELGTGDYNLTQKIPVKPGRHYKMSVAIRGPVTKAGLGIKLCPKLILYSDRYIPNCQEFPFVVVTPGVWETHNVSFDSAMLGQDAPFSWPTTLMLHDDSDTASIDVTGLRVTEDGHDVLANGNFAASGDRWMMISDFEHLGWHIKNIYIEIFFEMGVVGLTAFLMTITLALVTAFKRARRGDPLGIAIGGALVSFLTVGMVGSLFDNPRPAILFFLFLFCIQLRPSPQAARSQQDFRVAEG